MEITYTANGKAETLKDAKHPFEFTLPYASDFEFSAKLVRTDGSVIDIPSAKVRK